MNPLTRVIVSSRRFVFLIFVVSTIALVAGCNSYGGGGSVSVQIAPTSTSVQTGQTQQFTATVYGSSNTAVTWQVNGAAGGNSTVGMVSASGLYTAPTAVPNPAMVTVTAVSQADTTKSSSATVTVTAPPPITVTVSPKTPTVQVSTTQQFTATVTNTGNTAVTWQVNSVTGGNLATTGSINASGLYTAPATVPASNPVTVKAISQADSTKSDSATVTISTAPPPVTVTVSPKRAAITTGQTQTFAASVNNTPSNAVTWEVDTVPGGNSTVGTISAGGVYTPPTTGGVHSVVARSTVNTSSTSPASSVAVTDLAGVFTYHNDISRTGANVQEYALTTSTVKTATFGKLFTCNVDAAIYAQPLWVANLSFGGTKHNVVYVVTQHDSIYAFDADANPCVTLWSKVGTNSGSLIPSGETWVTSGDVSCGDLTPDIGIVGTPVIDPASNTIYLVTKTKNAAGTSFHQRIHALDLITGAEKSGSPVDISGTVSGTGNGSVGGVLSFDAKVHNQRPALLLEGSHLIISWASHCDFGTYHGWVMSYNASTLVQEATYSATPNGTLGGIWMAGGGPATDSSGNIFFATGNGTFDSANTNYGDAIVKLAPPSGGTFAVLTFFSPLDQSTLEVNDTDLGSGGLLLLPDLPGGAHPHLLAQAGKDSRLWIADRNALGGNSSTSNNVVQELDNALPGGMWGSPTYWNGHIYFGAAQDQGVGSNPTDPLRDFTFNTTTGAVALATSTTKIFAFTGPTPSVSSNGTTSGTGVVWALDDEAWASTPCTSVISCQGLFAYDAADLASELWDSNQAGGFRDLDGGAVKFAVPTVANGKVYVGNQNKLTVYGLLPN